MISVSAKGRPLAFNPLFKEQLKGRFRVEEGCAPLRISNISSKYRLMFGEEFKQMLEPRDQVMEHGYAFQLQLSKEDINELQRSKVPNSVEEKMK